MTTQSQPPAAGEAAHTPTYTALRALLDLHEDSVFVCGEDDEKKVGLTIEAGWAAIRAEQKMCNSHAALVEAARDLESAILDIANDAGRDSSWIADLPTYVRTTIQWEAFRAALKSAKEGQP